MTDARHREEDNCCYSILVLVSVWCAVNLIISFLFLTLLDSLEDSQDLSSRFGCSVSVGQHSFAQMEDDVDRQKLLGQPTPPRIQPASDLDHLTLQVQVLQYEPF